MLKLMNENHCICMMEENRIGNILFEKKKRSIKALNILYTLCTFGVGLFKNILKKNSKLFFFNKTN